MPITDEKLNENIKTVYFEESPIMSTYLVAVVVGVFDHIEETTADGMHIRPMLLYLPSFFFLFFFPLLFSFQVYVDYCTVHAGTKVCVYCPVGKCDKGKFALDVAVKALDIFTR